jgi:type IV secretion system protein VirB11
MNVKKQSIQASLPPVLREAIAPFAQYFSRKEIIEICVNKPGELWIETFTGWEHIKDSALTLQRLNAFCTDIATVRRQEFNIRIPLLATQIPGYGYRLQAVGSSVTEFDIALAIRVGATRTFALSSYFEEDEEELISTPTDSLKEQNERLLDNDPEYLEHLLKVGRNMLLSGGTGSGKTSALNSALLHVPDNQRIVIIEDTQELEVNHSNYVRLLKSKTTSDIAAISYKDLINATMRLRPDRILMGEIDIDNALPFLRLANTGHSGCMTTIHSNSPTEAITALIQNIKLSGNGNTSSQDLTNYINQAIDVIIQIKKNRKTRGRSFEMHFIKDKRELL